MSPRHRARIRVDVDAAAVLDALEWHRARLLSSLERLDAAALGAPSRCAGWTVADVVAHLRWGTDVAGELLRGAERGSGERLFEGFDPRTTPEVELAPLRGRDPAEHLDVIRAGTASLVAAGRGLAARGAATEADTPLGWVPWPLAVNHLLWDSWLHERDILVPLGVAHDPDPGEVRLVGSYQLVILGRVLSMLGVRGAVDLRLDGACGGAQRLSVGDEVVVDHPPEPAGEEGSIAGDAVAVIEAMSGRGALTDVARGPEPMLLSAGVLARVLAGT